MIGQTISHCRITAKLGEGGMGEVYLAVDSQLDRKVALKFLPRQMSSQPDAKARFLQEARAASALAHPNICTIHDLQEADGQLFIVMEHVEGQTLRDRTQTFTLKQVVEIGIQVADGLAAAHEKGIVHRDIKTENIMIRKDGIVQIMDFGLAKLRGASRLTKEGSTIGTVGYMSPEQVQGLAPTLQNGSPPGRDPPLRFQSFRPAGCTARGRRGTPLEFGSQTPSGKPGLSHLRWRHRNSLRNRRRCGTMR